MDKEENTFGWEIFKIAIFLLIYNKCMSGSPLKHSKRIEYTDYAHRS